KGLQYRDLRYRHGQCSFPGARRQGYGFCRLAPTRQSLCHRQQERKTRGQGPCLGTVSTQWRGVQKPYAVHRRVVADFQNRQCRGQARSPKPTVIYSDLPKDEAHGWKFLATLAPISDNQILDLAYYIARVK